MNSSNIDPEKKEVVYVPAYPGMMMPEEDEINLLDLWRVIWAGKWFIVGFTLFCTLIAVFVSVYVLPVTYKSEAVLMPIESNAGGLSQLAGLAGSLPIPIDLGGGGKSDHILAYLQSRNLKQKLIEKHDLLPRVYSDKWDHVKKEWNIDSPKDRPTVVKAIQEKALEDIYSAAQDKKTNLISLSWVDKDPAFAALMLKNVIDALQYYLDNEYESDAQRERVFVEGQLANASKELENWEKQVPDEKLTLSIIQRERLASQTVYTELRKQLELAKITEAKELVRFKVLDSPFVPEKKFKPKRALICALALITAGFFSILIIFIRVAVTNKMK